MNNFLLILLLSVVCTFPGYASSLIPLQERIDAAASGETLQLKAGRYQGPIVIDKPLVLNGGPGVVIDAGGTGTVVTIDTDGARLSNLHLTGSGSSHNDLDAGY